MLAGRLTEIVLCLPIVTELRVVRRGVPAASERAQYVDAGRLLGTAQQLRARRARHQRHGRSIP